MLIATGAQGEGTAAVAGAVRDWEPALDFLRWIGEGRLYDPDATVYAVHLGPACTLATERRRVAIGPGDLAVIPAGLAVEVEPASDFLAVAHLGRPPHHFRERFIQIWGFEHHPAPAAPGAGWSDVLAAEGRGHRLSYRVARPAAGFLAASPGPTEAGLLIALTGPLALPDQQQALSAWEAAWWTGGQALRMEGPGRVGWLSLAPEDVYEYHRARAATGSPEYLPPGVG